MTDRIADRIARQHDDLALGRLRDLVLHVGHEPLVPLDHALCHFVRITAGGEAFPLGIHL